MSVMQENNVGQEAWQMPRKMGSLQFGDSDLWVNEKGISIVTQIREKRFAPLKTKEASNFIFFLKK